MAAASISAGELLTGYFLSEDVIEKPKKGLFFPSYSFTIVLKHFFFFLV